MGPLCGLRLEQNASLTIKMATVELMTAMHAFFTKDFVWNGRKGVAAVGSKKGR